MGPVEMLGNLADFSMRFVSLDGGIVKSAQGVPVMTEKFVPEDPVRILLVPGAAPQVLPKEKAFFAKNINTISSIKITILKRGSVLCSSELLS